jgi:UDP-galactopyranose mutase
MARDTTYFDLVCFSHLRWDFVYQRPQHLLSRGAAQRRVFFIEEPIQDFGRPRCELHERDGVTVVVPRLQLGEPEVVERQLESLIRELLVQQQITSYVFWYYTPMALGFTRTFAPLAVVYDCMDELSLFKSAPALLKGREAELLRIADVVFTGGQSLYEAKREQHHSVHLFPSSIDRAHFAQARRTGRKDPDDQRSIPHPRLGYCGVLDERLDLALIREIAGKHIDWHLIMVGPVVKIDPAELPKASNIHYLGPKAYADLPAYIGGWDVALLPFALNPSTRFISPTKTPEYLAAGKPVVSTPVRDVVRDYGDAKLVRIGDTPDQFICAIADSLHPPSADWIARVDEHLSRSSWDLTWNAMSQLVTRAVQQKETRCTEGLGV